MTIKIENINSQKHTIRKFAYGIVMIAAIVLAPASSAYACLTSNHNRTQQIIEDNHDTDYNGPLEWESFDLDENITTNCNMNDGSWNVPSGGNDGTRWGLRQFITYQFKCHQIWLLNDFHIDFIIPMKQNMAEQLVSAGMHQIFSIGALLDAETQMETQRLIQRKMAEAHKDYQPSVGMCFIGSNVKSLGPSSRNAVMTTAALSQRAQDRHQSLNSMSSYKGPQHDREARLEQFIQRYCSLEDNNHGFEELCEASADSSTINKDIDYARTFDTPSTLDINMTDGLAADELTGDEIDIMALGSYLYGHDVIRKPSRDQMDNTQDNIDQYLDMRAVLAKRSVAENSFHTIVGLKTAGSSEEAEEIALTMHKIYEALGVDGSGDGITDNADARYFAGEVPSYYAQMEMLSQKIYQSPQFYTNLYDKPANVARKDVAMQAIGLMLDRDAYKSELRTEAILAVLLELEISRYQSSVQDKLTDLDETDVQMEPVD